MATGTGQFAYTVQKGGGYDLRVAPAVREQAPDVTTSEAAGTARRLPPESRADPEVPQLLENATSGLPAQPVGEVAPYKPRLQLDAAAQTAGVGVGADPFGTYLGAASVCSSATSSATTCSPRCCR